MRYFIGICLMVLGGAFLLDQFGVTVDLGGIVAKCWPLLIVGAAGIKIIKTGRLNFSNLLMLLIGLMLFAATSDIIPDVWSMFWPLMFVFIGLWMIFSHSRRGKKSEKIADHLDGIAFFSGYNTKISGSLFRGGTATAVFGGCDIDLSEAEIPPTGAELELTAAFGGIKIIVPRNWTVKSNGYPIFGGFDNKTKSYIPDDFEVRPVLNINYFVIFGGVSVVTKKDKF